ncbi:MAG TPA: hypothetical protein ENI93_01640 [Gammaproteobacteria bacterium]|nr:hypothetical protein [Gammaproteobacteria bacterium]
MRLDSVREVLRALRDAGVRYLVAGGLAVNAHGYLRFTKDVDFVLQLDPDNIRLAFSALAELGYRPAVPVTAEQFADPQQRQQWIREKGMEVLQLWSDAHPETPVDLFVTEPFDFEAEYRRSLAKPLDPDLPVHFVSLETLIRMKAAADREQDRTDIAQLRRLHGEHDV